MLEKIKSMLNFKGCSLETIERVEALCELVFACTIFFAATKYLLS